jgi:hypothetical protein
MPTITQSPAPVKTRTDVERMPIPAKAARNFFLEELKSETGPRIREITATNNMEMAVIYPQMEVANSGENSAAATFPKKMGKIAAITVVAKAELAQSYIHQALIILLRAGVCIVLILI